jgi:hypothetical protein
MMPANHRLAAVLAALAGMLLPVALGACGDDESAQAKQAVHTDFAAEKFTDPTKIDNRYSPLAPGTQLIYEGRSNRGHGRRDHQVIFTVTDLTKEVDGVKTVVLWDRDINAGKLLEGELAMWAQDDAGNVWLLGEYPEEYSDDGSGKFEAAPDTWLSGVQRAKAGIMMRADPEEDTSRYHQGLAPAIGFADVAQVYKTGQRDCVPTGCYDDVVVTKETNPDEPDDGFQLKYYAPNVGNTRAAPRGGKEKEILVLIKTRKLSAEQMDEVRREALKLDSRAYRSASDVWGDTKPAAQAPAD